MTAIISFVKMQKKIKIKFFARNKIFACFLGKSAFNFSKC